MVRLRSAFSSVRLPRPTPKGEAGYDNARENVDPHIKTKVLSSKEGSVTKVPVDGIDIANKDYVDNSIAAHGLPEVLAVDNQSSGNNILMSGADEVQFRASLNNISSPSVNIMELHGQTDIDFSIGLGGVKFSVVSAGIVIGSGEANQDYTLTFDGETNDGVITWKEDEMHEPASCFNCEYKGKRHLCLPMINNLPLGPFTICHGHKMTCDVTEVK